MCVNCSEKSAYQKPCCKSAPKFTVPQHTQPAIPSVNKHLFVEQGLELSRAVRGQGGYAEVLGSRRLPLDQIRVV